jgi:hypothetical protein
VLITNRHVAQIFLTRIGEQLLIGSRQAGERLIPRVDLLAEYKSDRVLPLNITGGLFLSPRAPGQPDVAVLRIEPNSEMCNPFGKWYRLANCGTVKTTGPHDVTAGPDEAITTLIFARVSPMYSASRRTLVSRSSASRRVVPMIFSSSAKVRTNGLQSEQLPVLVRYANVWKLP